MIRLQDLVNLTHHPVRLRRRGRALRPVKPSKSIELWYKAELIKLVKEIAHQTESAIMPKLRADEHLWVRAKGTDTILVADGIWEDIGDVFTRLAAKFGGIDDTAKRLASLAVLKSSQKVDASIASAVKNSLKIDIVGLLTKSVFGPVVERSTIVNVDLIKSIPEQFLKRVKQAVFDTVTRGERQETLVPKLREISVLTENRAKLIARDQVSKMNAALNEARQVSLGIDGYIWSTANDERVREDHAAHEGKFFRWDEPPDDTGHPGEDIQCRCVAIPYFKIDSDKAE